jgi:hypothetical protein
MQCFTTLVITRSGLITCQCFLDVLSEFIFIMVITWIKLVRTRIVRPENRKGPRYPNSLPFLAAQKAYAVKEATTPAVSINASSTILPETCNDWYAKGYN